MTAARPCRAGSQLAGDRNAARLGPAGMPAPTRFPARHSCRSQLAGDQWDASCSGGASSFCCKMNSVSICPAGSSSHFSLRGQREVTKRKATPVCRPPGIPRSGRGQALPYGCAFGLRGFADSASCAGRTRAHPCARPCGPCSTPARRQTEPAPDLIRGAPLIGLPGRTARKPATARFDHALSRNAVFSSPHAFSAWVQSAAPSSAGVSRDLLLCPQAKQPGERPNTDVRAGGHSTDGCSPYVERSWTARKWGRLLFGYCLVRRASCPPPCGPLATFGRAPARLVATQRKVTRAGRRPVRNAVDLDLDFDLDLAVKVSGASAARRSQAIASKVAPTLDRRSPARAR